MTAADGLRRAMRGLSEAAFRERFGTEAACREALFAMRWREGLTCPACGHRGFCQLRTRKVFQCNRCKKQLSLTAGTVFQDTKLPLIPTALIADRFGPLAAGDRGEPVGRPHEPVPRLAAGRDDRVVVGPDPQAELVLAQVLPDVLDRVQTLWGGRRG